METGENHIVEPDVLQYTNYRVYLRDYYEYKKKTVPAFSLRFFAEKAGLSSHAHLKLTIDGKRNITKNTVVKLIHGLGLDGQRAAYFESLVFFNQAQTDADKQVYYAQLLKASPRSKLHKMDKAQFRIFREWHHSAILEMVALKDFRPIPDWISKRLGGLITPAQVTESLKLLVEVGLLVKTANGFRQRDPLITTDDEVQDMMVKMYHLQMLKLSADMLSALPGPQRDVSALTFSIKREDFPNLKKHLQLMRKELLDFSAKAGEAEEVVQINIQLYPLTRGV
ncbi:MULTISPECIES: TIGR02147 family protein [unclassified Fibrobacter]|uniref:TIGR02147 family protein n=1 Tax=unclassified Fibrobacter TaxID=2634177 RepID=UPI00091F1AA4|nr:MULTISPECIES: TIGR02147 family protein [unclassified Fibrobacter]SHK74265.1 TIGR02147 family protein [Fibrobacter sp. UWB12]SIO37377.1 TIGR02147 family protein [Fibrobacter sp. UWB11]